MMMMMMDIIGLYADINRLWSINAFVAEQLGSEIIDRSLWLGGRVRVPINPSLLLIRRASLCNSWWRDNPRRWPRCGAARDTAVGLFTVPHVNGNVTAVCCK